MAPKLEPPWNEDTSRRKRQRQGFHEDSSIKNYLKYKVSASIVIYWGLRSQTRIFHWINSPQSTTCSTTLQDNWVLSTGLVRWIGHRKEIRFWSMRIPLVSLKMWSDSLAKCGSIFPEFRKSLIEEQKKEIKKPESCPWFKRVREEQDKEVFAEMTSWPAVVTAWSRYWIREWFPSGALKTNKLWWHRICWMCWEGSLLIFHYFFK